MVLIFKIFQVCYMQTPENFECFVAKVQKNGYGKIPKHGYLFLEKITLNMGMGPELPAAHPDQFKSENTPDLN